MTLQPPERPARRDCDSWTDRRAGRGRSFIDELQAFQSEAHDETHRANIAASATRIAPCHFEERPEAPSRETKKLVREEPIREDLDLRSAQMRADAAKIAIS